MKSRFIYVITLLVFLAALSGISTSKEKKVINPKSYFPIDNGRTLVFESSFGESTTKYLRDGEFTICLSEANKFKYKQTLIIKEDGAYVTELYQYFKIFLFIKKESTLTFENPLLRFPLPLVPGKEWKWEGEQYSDGDTSRVKVTGKVICQEFVMTKAGRIEAIKLESLVEDSDNVKNRVTEWYAEGIGLIKAKIVIEGGGVMGFLRDLLGYGTIEFELKEIRKQI
ncbi:MAG: hypothetical protein CO127_04865 [Ignavibacteria bacterium CG_4_9_14_3_um_filter_36_18]|nr:MAG: hypothetical protein CO127_04865 [Ignavibacteria bacterium CG_4_9_14_3_um_filter_36_18]